MATRKTASRKKADDGKVKRTAAGPRTLKMQARKQIDEFLRQKGFKDPSELVDEKGTWHFSYGPVDGLCFLDNGDGDLIFHVAAGVIPLPSDAELVAPLMRESLESNTAIEGAARFTIVDSHVFVSVTERVSRMKDEDYGRHIDDVVGVADAWMKEFKKKYGGTTRKRPRPRGRGRR